MEKRKRSMMRKEENLEQDLAQCTFTPDTTQSQNKKNKEHSKSTFVKPTTKESISLSPSPGKMHTPSKNKDLSRSTFESAKRDIFNRLFTMT